MGKNTPASDNPAAPNAAPRRHMLARFWRACSILLLAALVAVSISVLRGHADDARKAQLTVAKLTADTERLSRVEWQAAAIGRPSPELVREADLISHQIEARVRGWPIGAPRLDAETNLYLAAVKQELALRGAGRAAESQQVDQRKVDPRFDGLQRRLAAIDATQSNSARRASAQTDLGITVSLLLAGLVIILMLWRLDERQRSAARRREESLELQALSDALTGLPNRRKLMHDLNAAALRAAAGDRSCFVLCDLDGFKDYNDTFGHSEGDLLLRRMSGKLAQKVAPHGTAYRLGGDEFCAIFRVAEDELESAVAACHTALSESGPGFDVRASIGWTALPEEGSDAETAMRTADQRMYAQKNERGSSTKHQLSDLILRVLAEQDPELYVHVQDVGRLAADVGRALGLDDPQVATLIRAAALHDVGKVAIPESILHKSGPLDAHEREFMHRHTLIGEGILSAAPALEDVSRLVRSTHERYDGAGYPDGLRGEEIPLSSRIIFVCDSFNAMTTDRPYRRAIDDDAAVAELRRCAGTQFDPMVVEAFATARAHKSPHRRVIENRRTPEHSGVT